MGKQGLAAFLSEPRFEGLPATLETPGPEKKGADRKEVLAAKRLRKAASNGVEVGRRSLSRECREAADAICRSRGVAALSIVAKREARATQFPRERIAAPCTSRYLTWTPEIAREMTRRWISEVPSKIV